MGWTSFHSCLCFMDSKNVDVGALARQLALICAALDAPVRESRY